MTVKPIPDDFHSVMPYLTIRGAARAMEFYKRAFNAVEVSRLTAPDGSIAHAEVVIGDSHVMLADACEDNPIFSPDVLGGSSVGLHLYTEDVDSLFAQALAEGATEIRPVEDQFYGDRTGMLKDPFGHIWFLATRKEDLTVEEVNRRAQALFSSASPK